MRSREDAGDGAPVFGREAAYEGGRFAYEVLREAAGSVEPPRRGESSGDDALIEVAALDKLR
jgi:hypothetical protein